MEHTLYIILSQTGTVASRLIQTVTRAPYNHSSISLDRGMNEMYSFGRRRLYLQWIGGFIRENPNTHVFRRFPNTLCEVIALPVSGGVYRRALDVIDLFVDEASDFKYDVLGLWTRPLGLKLKRSHRFICSQFVATVLQMSGAWDLGGRDPYFTYPEDFRRIPGSTVVFRGKLRDWQGGRGLEEAPGFSPELPLAMR